jgi:hypothetical protein
MPKVPFYLQKNEEQDLGAQLVEAALAGKSLPAVPQPPSPEVPDIGGMLARQAMGMTPVSEDRFAVPEQPKAATSAARTPAEAKHEMNPAVKEYIAKKYGFGEGLDESALIDAQKGTSDEKFAAGMGRAANKIGAAIAGVKADTSAYDKMRDEAGQSVKDLQDRRKGKVEDMQVGNMMRDQEGQAVEDDVNSDASNTYRMLASKMLPGKDFSKMSATQIKRVLPSLEKLYDTQQKALDRKEARDERRSMFGMTMAEKKRTADEKKAQGMWEIEDRRQNIDAALTKLDKMIEDDGTWELTGSHNQDMERLVEQVATDMAKLQDPNSVARPSEVESVKKNLIRSGFQNSNATAREILKNFKGEVERRADKAYQVRGMQAPKSAGGTFPRQVRKGNQMATVSNEQELKEAQSEGWQ